VTRFVLLSQYGVSGGWTFFALPFGGIGVLVLLMRLGLLNSGNTSSRTTMPWHHNFGVQAPPPASPPSAGSVPQRLQELESLRATGAVSDTEYTAMRQQIITQI
jgi:hypothetical protein